MGIPPAWCKGCTSSTVIPAGKLFAWDISSGIKSAFFHFYSDSFQKGTTELEKTTFIPSTHKELHQKTWCCFLLTFKAFLLAPVLTLTWKDWGSHTRGSLQVRLHDLAFERHLNPLSFPSTTYGYTLIINNGYLEGFLRQAKVNHLVSTALCPWGCSTNYICQWIKKISSNTWYRIKS